MTFILSPPFSLSRKKALQLQIYFDPELKDASHTLFISVTGKQVLDETEKMSSVERPIRHQQQGLD